MLKCLFAGDIAFRFHNFVTSLEDDHDADYDIHAQYTDDSEPVESTTPRSHVTVCDINQSMLEVGKGRAAEAGITSGALRSTYVWFG